MSLPQKTYVDYKQAGFGDLGTDDAASVQPILDGQPLNGANLSRGGENLRGRTEIARDLTEDLLYYRDHQQYVLGTAGTLAWGGTAALGGTGVVNNTATLTITPLATPFANRKGFLRIGTAASNALTYTVQATAYGSDGMNAVFVEHRNTGAVSPSCVITAGPVYRIVVLFDAGNSAHDAPTIAPLVQAQLAGVPALSGKVVCASNGSASNVIAAQAEIAISARTHPAGTAGNGTLDVEQHTLAAGALGTFTASNTLVEGAVVAIRYDYVVEPLGGDPDDPKAGAAGGRAESILGRGNTDVSANLFLLDAFPQFAPGAIPLCKVVNNVLRWIDGTSIEVGTSVAPGSALGTTISAAGFAGPPTLVVGGGLLTTDTTPNAALLTTNTRLGQLRRETWTVTDGTNSTGGHYTSVTGVTSASASAAANGGEIYIRAGAYTTLAAGGPYGCTLIGESQNRVAFTLPASATVGGSNWELHNASVDRGADYLLVLGLRRMSNVTVSAGTLRVAGTLTASELTACTVSTSGTASTQTYGVSFSVPRVTARDCAFNGPAAGTVGGSVVQLEDNVQHALFENCSFASVGSATPVSLVNSGVAFTSPRVIKFVNCIFTNTAAAYTFDIGATTSTVPVSILFENCTFTNSTNGQIIRTAQAALVRVAFTDCVFRQNNTSTADVTRVRATPIAGGETVFTRCRTYVAQTTSTGSPANAIIELGGTGGTGAAGRVSAYGFDVVYEGTASALMAGDNVRLYQSTTATVENYFTDVDVNCGGLTITATGGHIVRSTSTGSLAPLAMGRLQVHNTPAAGTGGVVRLEYTHLGRLDIQASNTASQYTTSAIQVDNSRVLSGAVPFLRSSQGIGGFLSITGSPTARGYVSNLHVNGTPSTAAVTYSVFLSQATMANCDLSTSNTTSPSVIEIQVNSVLSANTLRYQHTGATVIQLTTGSAMGCRIVDNQILFNNATGTAAISVTSEATFTGGVVVGNTVANANATVPSLAAPPATSVVANNAFIGGYSF